MILFQTNKKIALNDEDRKEPTDLFAMSKSGWMQCSVIDDFNLSRHNTVYHPGLEIKGYEKKGYQAIRRTDIKWCKDIGSIDNAIMLDKELLKLICNYFKENQ